MWQVWTTECGVSTLFVPGKHSPHNNYGVSRSRGSRVPYLIYWIIGIKPAHLRVPVRVHENCSAISRGKCYQAYRYSGWESLSRRFVRVHKTTYSFRAISILCTPFSFADSLAGPLFRPSFLFLFLPRSIPSQMSPRWFKLCRRRIQKKTSLLVKRVTIKIIL